MAETIPNPKKEGALEEAEVRALHDFLLAVEDRLQLIASLVSAWYDEEERAIVEDGRRDTDRFVQYGFSMDELRRLHRAAEDWANRADYANIAFRSTTEEPSEPV